MKIRTDLVAKEIMESVKIRVQRIVNSKPEDLVAELKRLVQLRKNNVGTIAITEVSNSAGYATLRLFQEAGVKGKMWITARNERVCQFCRKMDGVTIPLEKNFFELGGTMEGEDGGKLDFSLTPVKSFPLHARCRCDLVPVFE